MAWRSALVLALVVVVVMIVVVRAEEGEELPSTTAPPAAAAAAAVAPADGAEQSPMLQQLFQESAQLLRMKAKLSQDYLSDPGVLKIYHAAKRQNAIALQRAKLLAQHSVAGPLKRMFGFVDAYLPEIEEHDDHHHGHHHHKHKEEDDDDDKKEEDEDKDKEDEDKDKEEDEEKEKEEKEKEEEEEKEKGKDGKKKKVSKKTLAQMTDLLAELMLKREKHPTGTKERDELNMEIDELLAHIDKAKGGDGHDRHELEKEDDHVKALEREHANDLILEKEYEAGLPIDDPNAYVNHHLDKLLQHVQTLRRSADGLGGMTLQELSDLEVETRALLLDLEEYKGEKVDTELLKIELDPTMGPTRRHELLEADRRRRIRRLRDERERELEDKEIESQAHSNQLKEIMARIEDDTSKMETLHHQHERLLAAEQHAVSAQDKLALDHEAELIEKELEEAKEKLASDERAMRDIATNPVPTRWSLMKRRLSGGPHHHHRHGKVAVDEHLIGRTLAHIHHLDDNKAVLTSSDCAAPNICDKTHAVEAIVRQVQEGEPVDGGVQAVSYQDECGACHTVLVSCQQQCQTSSCEANFCQQQVTTCQRDKCGNVASNVVARTLYPVRSDAVQPVTVAASNCADTSSC